MTTDLNDNLDREVDWWGRHATIIGIWKEPTYALRFNDGTRLVVGASTVTFISTTESEPPMIMCGNEHNGAICTKLPGHIGWHSGDGIDWARNMQTDKPKVPEADEPSASTSGIASQDFRDGAASGADSLANRLNALRIWGITITDTLVRELAQGVRSEYGGTVSPNSLDTIGTR